MLPRRSHRQRHTPAVDPALVIDSLTERTRHDDLVWTRRGVYTHSCVIDRGSVIVDASSFGTPIVSVLDNNGVAAAIDFPRRPRKALYKEICRASKRQRQADALSAQQQARDLQLAAAGHHTELLRSITQTTGQQR